MPLLKSRASWNDLVIAPTVQHPRGSVCMTCGRMVDYEGVEEGYPASATDAGTTFAKYLVRHHGAEELRTFDMGSTNWDYADVAQMARRTNWFDPTRHEGLGLGQQIRNPGEHDDIDAPKPFVGPLEVKSS